MNCGCYRNIAPVVMLGWSWLGTLVVSCSLTRTSLMTCLLLAMFRRVWVKLGRVVGLAS